MTRIAPRQPLRLHRFTLSGHCHRVELLLSLLELPWQAVDVDLAAGEQRAPRFLALNALGQVPVLEDGPFVLADSNAILVYLARSYGNGRFQLDSPALEAEQQRWFSVAAGPLAAGPAAARAHHLFGRALDIGAVRGAARRLLGVMDAHLGGREFLLGVPLSLADIACYSYIAHAPEGGVALDEYRALRAWLARIEALPGFVPMAASPRPEARPMAGAASTPDGAVFHAGELALQAEAGVGPRMARLGPQLIRSDLPEQHRAFFALLPFVVAGSLDAHGQPTASLLAGPPGFACSPDPGTLRITALPLAGDPLARNLRAGAPLGLLGIQPHTRRRNRANGSVLCRDDAGFSLVVQQSFGNCPRFIHAGQALFAGVASAEPAQESSALGERQRELVASADTFFIASAHPHARSGAPPAQGVDVSHRGGPAGFALFSGDDTFLVPDYPGNGLFNTLGNLRLNPRAGLLFIDRVQRHLLQLEASVEQVAGAHPHAGPEPSGRNLRFRVLHSRFFPSASPLRFEP